MFSSPGGQGGCSWSLTGNRCGKGGRRGKVEGSQRMDAAQVRARRGCGGEAGEIKQPLSTTGGGGARGRDSKSSSQLFKGPIAGEQGGGTPSPPSL